MGVVLRQDTVAMVCEQKKRTTLWPLHDSPELKVRQGAQEGAEIVSAKKLTNTNTGSGIHQ